MAEIERSRPEVLYKYATYYRGIIFYIEDAADWVFPPFRQCESLVESAGIKTLSEGIGQQYLNQFHRECGKLDDKSVAKACQMLWDALQPQEK